MTRLYDKKLLGAASFAVLAFGFLVVFPWPADMPGSLEDTFARARIGMGQDEAVAVLESCDDIDGCLASGTTKDGRSWVTLPSFKGLPPPHEIEHAVLEISNNEGRKVEVTLGPGGIVSHKQLSPGVWQYRVDKVCRAFARAESDLLSVPWWKDQLHKGKRSLRRRWR